MPDLQSLNQTSKSKEQTAPQPPGIWPTPTPRWTVYLSAALWLSWFGFMVWMMLLRLQTASC